MGFNSGFKGLISGSSSLESEIVIEGVISLRLCLWIKILSRRSKQDTKHDVLGHGCFLILFEIRKNSINFETDQTDCRNVY